tara:strand:- start:99 stop:1301 length:1203 start_codon:yes stop_codon:yes gene_type:complete
MTYSTEVSHTQTVTGNRDFSVTFPFLAVTDLKVQLNGVTKTVTNDYTIVQSGANTVVNFNTAPADNATIRIFRNTDIDLINSTYAAGSAIRSTDLNSNNTQLLYAAQEFGTLKEDSSVSFTLGNKGDIQVNSSSDWLINNNVVELANMADNSVGTSELVNDSVTDDKMANNAIATASLKDNAVTIAKMADNSVGTSEIVNSSVTRAKAIPGGLNPVGTVIWYAGSTAPAGYLKANGDSIANGSGTTQGVTADFSELYAIVGSTLPDIRGEFIRGWDDGKGTDSGRAIRSTQSPQNQQHSHGATSSSSASISDTGHRHWISSADRDDANMTGTGSNTQNYGLFADAGSYSSSDPGRSTGRYTASEPAGGGITVSVTTTTSTNNEGGNLRPTNLALLACIKY